MNKTFITNSLITSFVIKDTKQALIGVRKIEKIDRADR